jgi:hypothetical protein
VKYEVYGDLKRSPVIIEYTFKSVGTNGAIPIVVHFTETEDPGIFDLAFGLVLNNGILNDVIRLNNGDRDNILATIVAAISMFTTDYPEKVICFTGSSPGRTRLYRMTITLNLEELSKNFTILGDLGQSKNVWEKFEKDRPYIGFAIKRKTNNL